MDQNFRKRLQKTLCCGDLEDDHCPLALTELAVEYFQDLAPHKLDFVDIQSASTITSQDTVSPSSVAMSMVYAKRLQRKRPDYVTRMSSSDLFLISMMMASKYLYDEGVEEEVFNDEWAEHAGLDTDQVNTMEMDFLEALDWELYIKKEDFDHAMLSIEKRVALRQGLGRGWFSYTDLYLLLGDTWTELLGPERGLEWLQVMVVSSAAYVAGIMTMVGSTVLVTSAAALTLTSTPLPPSSLLLLLLSPTTTTTPPLTPPPLPPPPSSLLCSPLLPTSNHHRHRHPCTVSAGCPVADPPSSDLVCADVPADLNSNHTSQTAVGEEREKKEGGEEGGSVWEASQSLVDTVLSQLFAVLALKSHLAHFLYAVSDNYSSTLERNHSQRNHNNYRLRYSHHNHHRSYPTDSNSETISQEPEMEEGDSQHREMSPCTSDLVLLPDFTGMQEGEAGLDWFLKGGSHYCCCCSKRGQTKAPQQQQQQPPWAAVFPTAVPESLQWLSHPASGAESVLCSRCEGKCWQAWEGGGGGEGGMRCRPLTGNQPCLEVCCGHCLRAESLSALNCGAQALLPRPPTPPTHSVFPDIVIGFSTSMPPPVFAA